MQVSSQSAHGVSLRRLFPDATFLGAKDIVVTSCSSDSRTCKPGDLFVSLVGAEHDGHDFAKEAFARGARGVLAEQMLMTSGRPQCIVDDSREALGILSHALAGNPSHRIKTIGVTGTNGKTTTTTLIAGILRAAGHRVGLMGTLGHWDGEDYAPSDLTTPTSPVLANWLARMEANGCSHAIIEVSSHGLAQRRTAGLMLDAACITNVRRDHLDFHTTLQNYRAAKARLLDHLSPSGLAILNADCVTSRGILNTISGPVLTVSMNDDAEITAEVIERNAGEQIFLLSASDDTVCVRTRMIGDHHVANCLVAAATGLAYGIDLTTIARGLESVDQVPGRLERINCGQDFSVYVDYAQTPDALECVLDAIKGVTPGRIICVMGAGGERDREKRAQMAEAVADHAELTVLTNDNPRGEDPLRIIADLQMGFESKSDVRVEPNRKKAIAWALQQAREGDAVLIAGKGHEEFQIIGNRRIPHDDREVARTVLYRLVKADPFQSQARMAA